METPILPKKELTLKTIQGYVFIDLCEIVRFEAERNYTLLMVTFQQDPFKLKLNISAIEKIIPENCFLFRCHRSHIVNLRYVHEFKEKSRILVTKHGPVTIAESNIKEFKKLWCRN